MKSRILFLLYVCTILLGTPIPSYSAVGMLDTTTINFSGSGTPNTIPIAWSSSPLYIDDGLTINYFTVEMIDMNSNFGNPSAIVFDAYIPGNSASFAFCDSAPSWCVASPTVGNIVTVDSNHISIFGWNFLNRLVFGNNPNITSGAGSAEWSRGGSSATISGSVLVNVYGDIPVVPEPLSSILFLSGGSLLAGQRYLKRKMKI